MTAPAETLPVLTGEERRLLAAVHCWARRPAADLLPTWETTGVYWRNRPTADDPEYVEVAFGPGWLEVEIRTARRAGRQVLDETVTPCSVREAVDLLVAWGILPVELSSAYAAGQRPPLLSLPPTPQPWLPPGWHPQDGAR